MHTLAPELALATGGLTEEEDADAEIDLQPWWYFQRSLEDAARIEIAGTYEIELSASAVTIVKKPTGDHRWIWWAAMGGGVVCILLTVFYFDESMRVLFGVISVLLVVVGAAQLTQHRRVVVDDEAEEIVISDVRLWGLWSEDESLSLDDIDGLAGGVYTETRGSTAKENRTVSTYNRVTAYVKNSDERIELVDLPLTGEASVIVESDGGEVLFEGEIDVTVLIEKLAEAFGERLEMRVR